jgi:hypothetical protein
MTYVRYEFWLETRGADEENFTQVTETLRSGAKTVAKRRLEDLITPLESGTDFQGIVEEGRYIKDPEDPSEIIFEQSGRSWLVQPAGDTIGWVDDYALEDVQPWAVSI